MATASARRKGHERNLSQQAYYLILEKILKSKIPLGAPLSRRKLAKELGMSFLPISQALERLEYEGLVESQPRVGTRVKIPTPQSVQEHYILREALECQAARLFAERASSKERLELTRMAKKVDKMLMSRGGDNGDADSVFRTQTYHTSFHMRLVECTRSTGLFNAIGRTHVLIFNWLYDISTKLVLPPRWHERLMKGLVGKNPEAAERAMRRHVNYGIPQILERLDQQLRADVPRTERLSTYSQRGTSQQAPRRWRVKHKRPSTLSS